MAAFSGVCQVSVRNTPSAELGINSSCHLSRIVRNLTGYLQRRYTNYVDGLELMIRMTMIAMIKSDMVIIACLA
jgi:hypothetical protein